jgi:hypothetical protein
MSTPEQPTTQQPPPSSGYGPPSYGGGWGSGPPGIGAIMPVPGNAEMVVFVLATIIVAIIALASDEVNAGFFVDYFKWVTAAYLVSRGIAKASRVLER